eukprot:scaffold66318_cov15-Tisochrysis_lutea.AAC.1
MALPALLNGQITFYALLLPIFLLCTFNAPSSPFITGWEGRQQVLTVVVPGRSNQGKCPLRQCAFFLDVLRQVEMMLYLTSGEL